MVAAMAFTLSFAGTKSFHVENSIADRTERFDLSCNMTRLYATLDLDEWQMQAVEVIHNNLNNEVQSLATMHGPRMHHLVRQAVREDARQMRRVLNDKQFSTYMTLLTTTLRNKHL